MGPRGELDLPLGLLWSNVAPQRPPGRLLEDFGAHCGGHFELKICEILVLFFDVFPGCLLEGFWSVSGVVLGDSLVPKK